MKRFRLFKALQDCANREEFDYQSTKGWHDANGLDYLMLSSPTLAGYKKAKKLTKEVTENIDRIDRKSKYVNSKMTYETYRSLVKKARASFTYYKQNGRVGQLNNHLDKLAKGGYASEYSDTKLDIDNYKNPTL